MVGTTRSDSQTQRRQREAFTGLLAVVPARLGFLLFHRPPRFRAGAIGPTGGTLMHAANTIGLDHDARRPVDVNSRHSADVTRTVWLRAMGIAPPEGGACPSPPPTEA
ncbi:hypothetical protein MKK63_25435 [Methylobacterium sp. J-088]|uniref:hypothetical protein n=1 Tax=Methylobacterium sp. J-088 TaxID=2836664 RepID=UPI001FBA0B35|nr:hypothetical protein [Methylobacterium sp. J-088]MCJ2066022.1 hypothetical protein [Methylobacterium sp. J-088]